MREVTKQANSEILLLACYELGHQPLSLAWPAAALEEAGFSVAPHDLSVENFPIKSATEATLVAIAAPMHTAMRIGVAAARQVRELNPYAHICFYGLYADLNADFLFQQNSNGETYLPLADSVISGEYELPLVRLAQELEKGVDISLIPGISTGKSPSKPFLHRIPFSVPNRDLLPPLMKYNSYINGGEPIQAGYVEASRGCLHTCKHCPIVPVYAGRFFVVPADVVLSDIRQQVAAGAGHISFGDPDFLNGPGHVLNILRSMKDEFSNLTFDFTTRVEHLLKHQKLLPELRDLGASFVISAFEATSNDVLLHLDKGHTVQDMEQTLGILAEVGLPVRPSWVPFTPWTTLDDYLTMLEWIYENDLVPNIPMVQYSIRLLIPPRSELLPEAQESSWLGQLDAENFSYLWTHPDPQMDRLQERIAVRAQENEYEPELAFEIVAREAYDIAGRPLAKFRRQSKMTAQPPHLSEHWFC